MSTPHLPLVMIVGMGWRGTLRSVNAAVKAAERNAECQRKADLRQAIADEAQSAVEAWEEHLDELISIHTVRPKIIDWESLKASPEPITPKRHNVREAKVVRKLDNFEPNLIEKLIGGAERRKAKLLALRQKAIEQDKEDYLRALNEYEQRHADWIADQRMATRIMNGEAAAYKEVLEQQQSLSSEGLIGTAIEFEFFDKSIHAYPYVHTDEIVPKFRRKQLASGKLSETKMPAGQFNELYQDYVASAALRIASDIYALLPLSDLYVTCRAEMLNTATGHLEPTPILSVRFVRETFEKLDLDNIDPSDSLSNFVHNMKFKKTKGFERIEALEV